MGNSMVGVSIKESSQRMNWTDVTWSRWPSYTTRYWSRASASRNWLAACSSRTGWSSSVHLLWTSLNGKNSKASYMQTDHLCIVFHGVHRGSTPSDRRSYAGTLMTVDVIVYSAQLQSSHGYLREWISVIVNVPPGCGCRSGRSICRSPLSPLSSSALSRRASNNDERHKRIPTTGDP